MVGVGSHLVLDMFQIQCNASPELKPRSRPRVLSVAPVGVCAVQLVGIRPQSVAKTMFTNGSQRVTINKSLRSGVALSLSSLMEP